jgi:predicted DNA-binding protein (MmcQ/YjbR family)
VLQVEIYARTSKAVKLIMMSFTWDACEGDDGEMNIENLRELCRSLSAVTEDVKWGHDLCFSVAGKMFCVAALDGPLSVSFKVRDEEFDELSNSPGMRPAPYVARYKWVLVEDVNKLNRKEWAHYVKQSYELVRAKLPKKLVKQHGLWEVA